MDWMFLAALGLAIGTVILLCRMSYQAGQRSTQPTSDRSRYHGLDPLGLDGDDR